MLALHMIRLCIFFLPVCSRRLLGQIFGIGRAGMDWFRWDCRLRRHCGLRRRFGLPFRFGRLFVSHGFMSLVRMAGTCINRLGVFRFRRYVGLCRVFRLGLTLHLLLRFRP